MWINTIIKKRVFKIEKIKQCSPAKILFYKLNNLYPFEVHWKRSKWIELIVGWAEKAKTSSTLKIMVRYREKNFTQRNDSEKKIH